MRHAFYDSIDYREGQSARTKENWRKGILNFLIKKEKRVCGRDGCGIPFDVNPSDPKQFCSRSCAAAVNNVRRGPLPKEVREKIALAMAGKIYPNRKRRTSDGSSLVVVVCANSKCGKVFSAERWMKRKFCSNDCVMKVIGGRPTSPRAARGKAGIRKDISPTIYFYSRWEANIARLYTYLGIAWVYAPTSFNIGGQFYTPDFYLPELKKYVEVKNFWWEYSKERDKKFRKLYPQIRLDVILGKDYLKIEKEYSPLIQNWEYRNSKFS